MSKFTIEYDKATRRWMVLEPDGEWICDARDKASAKLIAEALTFALESASFRHKEVTQ